MKLPDVRIELTGPGRGQVFIDGREVSHVRELTLSAEVGNVNRLSLTLNVDKTSIVAKNVNVRIKDRGLRAIDVTSIGDATRKYAPSYFDYNQRRRFVRDAPIRVVT